MASPSVRRFVCLHGHFYQPPRENPWLEAVEVQDSAAPVPRLERAGHRRVLRPEHRRARARRARAASPRCATTTSRISFNFGPTLLSWMEQARPDVYAQILRADRRAPAASAAATPWPRSTATASCRSPAAAISRRRCAGASPTSCTASAANPTACGCRRPPSTAPRSAVLAEHGIRFTILAPTQAARVRYGDGAWEDVHRRTASTAPGRTAARWAAAARSSCSSTTPRSRTPSPSAACSTTAASWPRRLTAAAAAHAPAHRWCTSPRTASPTGTITASARWRWPPPSRPSTHERQVRAHQLRRVPRSRRRARRGRDPRQHLLELRPRHRALARQLRLQQRRSSRLAASLARRRCAQALDWLKTQLDDLFERQGATLLRDPWAARDAYVGVLLQRDAAAARRLPRPARASARRSAPTASRVWKLLEMQRHALLSFTSCGWFFDESSGIETVQVLTYAARALQLAAELGTHLEPEFLRRLQPLRSNLPSYADGAPAVSDAGPPAGHRQPPPGRPLRHGLALPRAAAGDAHVYAYRVTADRPHRRARRRRQLRHRPCPCCRGDDRGERHVRLRRACTSAATTCTAPSPRVPRSSTATPLDQELRSTFLAEPLSELVRRIDALRRARSTRLRDVFVAERRQHPRARRRRRHHGGLHRGLRAHGDQQPPAARLPRAERTCRCRRCCAMAATVRRCERRLRAGGGALRRRRRERRWRARRARPMRGAGASRRATDQVRADARSGVGGGDARSRRQR